ncbi:MAG: hypothetical protein A2289_13795 [Deltaproteobacteria bacterium RIFOXYA12_FULL_58_15]|nr:MAG: hypothetical protein A2289_13795 [Deltaproteobacteria bacterium RIFOXYA12_FULL_58_15]OGR07457.1 MAG: hypothetical protein A2341_26405 [Deltaproteobacteria bacterium RIFOXYB12_FULL_58_9]
MYCRWSILLLLLLHVAAPALAAGDVAIAFGGGGCGKLDGGEALPCRAANFETFADTACVLGRNYLHPLIVKTVVGAYATLAKDFPHRTWQYGETGKAEGGPLWPHKTHQNGLAADFFVPVINKKGEPDQVPISVFNKFGYDVEFDKRGRVDGLRIDFGAVGAHLLALEVSAKSNGVRIDRIIITPDFHAALLREVPAIEHLLPLFMKKEAWVRHDEHYHVDFELPSNLRRPLACQR